MNGVALDQLELRVRRLTRRSREVQHQLERASRDRPDDVDQQLRLMAEKQDLIREIDALNRADVHQETFDAIAVEPPPGVRWPSVDEEGIASNRDVGPAGLGDAAQRIQGG